MLQQLELIFSLGMMYNKNRPDQLRFVFWPFQQLGVPAGPQPLYRVWMVCSQSFEWRELGFWAWPGLFRHWVSVACLQIDEEGPSIKPVKTILKNRIHWFCALLRPESHFLSWRNAIHPISLPGSAISCFQPPFWSRLWQHSKTTTTTATTTTTSSSSSSELYSLCVRFVQPIRSVFPSISSPIVFWCFKKPGVSELVVLCHVLQLACGKKFLFSLRL